jgi:hypothetical protein
MIMIDGQLWIMQAVIAIISLRSVLSVVKPGMYEGGLYFDMQNECITESGYFQTKMLKEPVTEGRGMD